LPIQDCKQSCVGCTGATDTVAANTSLQALTQPPHAFSLCRPVHEQAWLAADAVIVLLLFSVCCCCCLQAYDDVSALVYTLRAVLGGGNLTTQPPNTELTALSCGSAAGDCDQATSGSDEPCEADAAGVGAGLKGGSRGKGGVTL
jgi:hypothetical protein